MDIKSRQKRKPDKWTEGLIDRGRLRRKVWSRHEVRKEKGMKG